MIKHLFTYLLLTTLALPFSAFAQMSSENFVVEGPAIGSGAVTLNATSTNYDLDNEIGGLFQIVVATPPAAPTNNSNSGGGGKIQKKDKAVEEVSATLIGPTSVGVGNTVNVVVRVQGQSNGDTVLVEVAGANSQLVTMTQRGNGLYLGSYIPTVAGTDFIRSSVNGVLVPSDSDGVSDGTLHVTVTAPVVAPPLKPVEPIASTTDATETPLYTDEFVFDSGITAACNRAFTWEETSPVTIYRTIANSTQVLLAIIGPAMPWYVDTEPLEVTPVTYRLVRADGVSGTVTFTAEDFLNCTPDPTSVTATDIDADQNNEQYIEGIYQDIDGSSRPMAVTADGVVLDTDNDDIADLFWNPELGTSPVITATDRIFIIDKEIAPTQDYLPLVNGGYRVVLDPSVKGSVAVRSIATSLEELRQAADLPNFDWLALLLRVIEIVGIGAGSLTALFTLTKAPFSMSDVVRVGAYAWRFLFSPAVFWKRRRAWGTIYDSVTKAPVDPAYVELFDETGAKQAEAITDLDGRYGFLVPEGTYEMKVRKVHYQFPSAHHTLTGRDVLYSNLYFGGPFSVSATVTRDVPMDPEGYDWNQYEKMRTHQTSFIHRFDPLIARSLDVLYYAGAFAVLWQFVRYADVLSGVILLVYVVLLFLRYFRGKPPLYGSITRNAEPLSFAVVRVLRGEHEVFSKVTDAYGRYVAIVPQGSYTVCIEEKKGAEEYVSVFEKTVSAKKGYINMNVRL